LHEFEVNSSVRYGASALVGCNVQWKCSWCLA